MHFSYLIDKIYAAQFEKTPFEHIHINNFLSQDDFERITQSESINIKACDNDPELFDELFKKGFRIINFPGCIADMNTYIKWRKTREYKSNASGFGLTLRLEKSSDAFLNDLSVFLSSDEFNFALADKFGIDYSACTSDGGIQKYLDGYEISPHPDIRRKALTFMVNINTIENTNADIFTHYMTFKPQYRYIYEYWNSNPLIDRSWVPWDWCETAKKQTENNSIVIFAPANDTLHAIRARYDHLDGQRTQLYGNLWFNEVVVEKSIDHSVLDIPGRAKSFTKKKTLKDKLKSKIPVKIIKLRASLLGKNRYQMSRRDE